MNILEVRNNLLKLSYEEDIRLGDFITVKDEEKTYIAQILHIEAGRIGKVALAKLLFLTDLRHIFDYDGSIPSVRSTVETVLSKLLLQNLKIKNPILLGKLAQDKNNLVVDDSFLSDKLLICSDNSDNNNLLINNICRQLSGEDKKVVVLKDFSDWLDSDLTACENFKLPLNADAIDFICEYGLSDANDEGKAVITEIFNEIREYAKTVPFIPFDVFQSVVSEQYSKTKMLQLVLLNSKLRKYGEAGIFATLEQEFEIFDEKVRTNNLTKVDLSNLNSTFLKEYYSYILLRAEKALEPLYLIIKLDNENSDKKMLKKLLFADNIKPIIITSYNYKYLAELKQYVSNMILCTPTQQQSDFTDYKVFLNKLLNDEFLALGKATHNIPFIVKLEEIDEVPDSSVLEQQEEVIPEYQNMPANDFYEPIAEQPENTQTYEEIPEVQEQEIQEAPVELSLSDEEIEKEADKIFSAPENKPVNNTVNNLDDSNNEAELSDEDLDFIDGLSDDFEIVEDAEETAENENAYDELSDVVEIVEEDRIAKEIQDDIDNLPPKDDNFEVEILEDNAVVDVPEEEPIKINDKEEIVEDDEPLPTKSAVSQAVPEFSAEISKEDMVESDPVQQGDIVTHLKHGKGVVEKMINYGNKTLCFINFDTPGVGKRLIDPALELIKKV